MINKIHKHLVRNAASILRPPVKMLPDIVQKKVLLEALKVAFKESLEDGDFEFLEGKWLLIEVKDLGFKKLISYKDEHLVIERFSSETQPDVTFSGGLNDLVLIAGRKEDPDTLFFQRRLMIEGDTELGLEVKNLMDSIDLDSLPTVLNQFINHLADFVYQGIQDDDVQPNKDVTNAYTS